MKRLNAIFIGVLAALIAFPCLAETTGEAKRVEAAVDSLIAPLVVENMIGGAILIARGDKVLLAKGFGFADREHMAPNTAQTPFRLASVSKSITAVAVMQLVDMGLLRLDSRLESFVPGFPNGDRITIEHLLGHRSGIPSDVYLQGFREKSILGITLDQAIEWIKSEARPRFAPGERFDYSNSGYLLLTAVIEKASGMPFEQYLARKLFTVAGMNASGLDSGSRLLPHRARGYSRSDKGDVVNCPYRDASYGWGYGALYSTVEDLFHFARALVDGRLLSEASRQAMWMARSDTPWRNRYGLGWFIEDLGGNQSAVSLGATGGFVATLRHFPVDDTVVVVLMNQDFMLYNEIFEQLSLIALGMPWKPILNDLPDSTQALFSALAGTYKMDDGTLMELRVRENRPELGEKGSGNFFRVHVLSERTGYVAAQNALLRFRKSESGEVELFALYGNLAWNGRRVSAAAKQE